MKYDMWQIYPTELTSDYGMQYGEDTVGQQDIASIYREVKYQPRTN